MQFGFDECVGVVCGGVLRGYIDDDYWFFIEFEVCSFFEIVGVDHGLVLV